MNKFKVTTTMTNEVEICDNMEEVNAHIEREIKWFNSPNENENGRGYSDADFIVEQL